MAQSHLVHLPGESNPEGPGIFILNRLFSWWDWGLNSQLHTCKAGALLLKPHLQSILLWLFGDGGSRTIFLGWPGTTIFLISASQVARITGVSHQCPASQAILITARFVPQEIQAPEDMSVLN
jgi:hypothetical protein